MQAIEIIKKKRQKEILNTDEIRYMVNNYVSGHLPDYQMSAFLMSICVNGMNEEETSSLTNIMLHSGEVIEHKKSSKPLIDKHSTGGVGDKISIPLAPAAAACGLRVPMIAGRGLGHTGGTLDKLEAIPGFRTNISSNDYIKQVEEVGCIITGQTSSIAPADKKIYALRDVSGCVESIPLICSSIMSKKLAEGIDGLVLDVKFGSGAFMKEFNHAKALASAMVNIGSHMNKHITVCITDMDQPLGSMIGNSLEIIESIDILKNQGPKDSTYLTIELGAEMLLLGHLVKSLEEGRKKITESLNNGSAFNKFIQMVKAQGGDISYIENPTKFSQSHKKIVLTAKENGFISRMDCESIGIASSLLGGGKFKLTDSIDPAVGIEIHAKIGDKIEKDQPIFTMHVNSKGIEEATIKLTDALSITQNLISKPTICLERISTL